jgi:hypothetical protein
VRSLKKARLEIAGLLKQAEEFQKKNFERMQNLSAWNAGYCRKKYLFAPLFDMLISIHWSKEFNYFIGSAKDIWYPSGSRIWKYLSPHAAFSGSFSMVISFNKLTSLLKKECKASTLST